MKAAQPILNEAAGSYTNTGSVLLIHASTHPSVCPLVFEFQSIQYSLMHFHIHPLYSLSIKSDNFKTFQTITASINCTQTLIAL